MTPDYVPIMATPVMCETDSQGAPHHHHRAYSNYPGVSCAKSISWTDMQSQYKTQCLGHHICAALPRTTNLPTQTQSRQPHCGTLGPYRSFVIIRHHNKTIIFVLTKYILFWHSDCDVIWKWNWPQIKLIEGSSWVKWSWSFNVS